MRLGILMAEALAVVLLGRPAAAQTTAELLQKGIYTQETVGDLDSAIQIYRKVVAAGNESRALSAQAQFRLGVCLLKKNDRAGAAAAFEQLVREYPEQKDLVAQAREYMPGEAALLPSPWTEGEIAEYRMKMAGGMEVGTFTYSVEGSPTRPRNLVLTTRIYMGGAPQQWSRVEADRETMRPILCEYFSAALGESRLEYEPRQVRAQPKGREARTVALDDLYWDNEEALWIMRRLPLSVGYKTKLRVVSPIGAPVALSLSVQGIEDVATKAGRFKSYKVELAEVRQYFYFAVDAPRHLVKIDLGGPVVELAGLRRIDDQPVQWRDTAADVSATLPPGWMTWSNSGAPAGETSVSLLDPRVRSTVALWFKKTKTDPAVIAQRLNDSVEEKVKSRAPVFKDYRIRPGSVQHRQVGGRAAISALADYIEGDRARVEYLVWVRSGETSALLFARMAADEFNQIRPTIDSILDTVKMP